MILIASGFHHRHEILNTHRRPRLPPAGDLEDEDDLLAAEMEAAFEESAREEEARRQQYSQHASGRYNVASDDESEVSEEE